MWNGYNFSLIAMRDKAFPFHDPANSGEANGRRSMVIVASPSTQAAPPHTVLSQVHDTIQAPR